VGGGERRSGAARPLRLPLGLGLCAVLWAFYHGYVAATTFR